MTAGRQHDPLDPVAPQESSILVELHVRRSLHGNPPGRRGGASSGARGTNSDAVLPASMSTCSVADPASCCNTTV